MKIVCTHCQTGYQVAISEVKSEGIEFKCVKCRHFFLGGWCRTLNNDKKINNLDHLFHEYHWADAKKVKLDETYIKDLNNRLIPVLKDNLNIIHQETYNDEFWNIILGYWLLSFSTILFEIC